MKTRKVRNVSAGGFCELEVDAPVGDGGEATIYALRGDSSLLAKVYIQPNDERAAKLACMLANPPTSPIAGQPHRWYAWPTALIASAESDAIIGFLMPRIAGMKSVFDFYNPGQRRRTSAYFNYRYLIQTARNIAGIMAELHSKGYVIGDVSQKNVFVSDSALVTLLDTDSFQIRDPQTGHLHRCYVRSPGFIAPEAFKVSPMGVERRVEEDLFGLGVLIFHLLMEGVHPFSCVYPGSDEPPKLHQSIQAGNFAYGKADGGYKPMPTAPPLEMLAPEIRQLILRCFVDGHRTPSARPTAREWQKALSKVSQELLVCSSNSEHYYAPHLGPACPWCARVRQGLPDSFPAHARTPPPPADWWSSIRSRLQRHRRLNTVLAVIFILVMVRACV